MPLFPWTEPRTENFFYKKLQSVPASSGGGLQIPIPMQPFAQGEPDTQWPFVSHFCGTSTLHCMLPGTHSPPHIPLAQTNMQVDPFVHCPWALHVCGVRLSAAHCWLPGEQTPVHMPFVQTLGHAMPLSVQWPIALQT